MTVASITVTNNFSRLPAQDVAQMKNTLTMMRLTKMIKSIFDKYDLTDVTCGVEIPEKPDDKA